MPIFKCYLCSKWNVVLYRVDAKGDPDTRWACREHVPNAPDPEVEEISNLIADINSINSEIDRHHGKG